MAAVLVAHALTKSYLAGHGRCWARVQVLSGLSLSLHRGEGVLVTGGPGAGKTTLLHCLTGLRRLDAGTVRWTTQGLAPYRLCGTAADLLTIRPPSVALAELADDAGSAAAWMEALHRHRAEGGGWLAFATRAGPFAMLADRVLELHEGMLRPAATPGVRRVAEERSMRFGG